MASGVRVQVQSADSCGRCGSCGEPRRCGELREELSEWWLDLRLAILSCTLPVEPTTLSTLDDESASSWYMLTYTSLCAVLTWRRREATVLRSTTRLLKQAPNARAYRWRQREKSRLWGWGVMWAATGEG